MNRKSYSLKKPSNRARMRMADAATAAGNAAIMARDENVIRVLSLQHLLMCVLAQKGGEVIVTKGTVAQIVQGMTIDMSQDVNTGELTIKLLAPVEETPDGISNDSPDDNQDGSSDQASPEGQSDSGA
jgi:hypothetical protein